jgi:tRNA threonylcarbamoyladenosine biosynthesis protein TsaB
MKILGIQTSTLIWSVAVIDGEQILGEYTFNAYDLLSKLLVPAIDDLLNKTGLKSKDLNGIAVTKGPGWFTGGRVGLSVAKGLVMGLDIPVVGISTLEALALNLSHASYPVCPIIPSCRQDVYVAIYKISPEGIKTIEKESVFDIGEWLRKIDEPTIFVGDGAVKYKDIIKKKLGKSALFAPMSFNYLRASDVAFQALGKIKKATKLSSLNLKAEYLRPAVEGTGKKRK